MAACCGWEKMLTESSFLPADTVPESQDMMIYQLEGTFQNPSLLGDQFERVGSGFAPRAGSGVKRGCQGCSPRCQAAGGV